MMMISGFSCISNQDETDEIDKRSKIKEQEDIIRKESESAFKYFCLKQIYLKKMTLEAISNFLKRKGHSALDRRKMKAQ